VDLTRVLLTAARGGVRISRELRRAGLSGETGATGDINVQGEAVKKMDVIANQILVEAFSKAGDVAWVASEEMEEPLAIRSGAHLFWLDPESEDFILSAQGLRIPEKGKLYATNEGQRTYYHLSTRRLLDFLQTPDRVDGRPYSTRYSGCLVTDVHRILLEGG